MGKFQNQGIPLIWTEVGQGPFVLAVSASGGCLDKCFPCHLFAVSLCLGDDID